MIKWLLFGFACLVWVLVLWPRPAFSQDFSRLDSLRAALTSAENDSIRFELMIDMSYIYSRANEFDSALYYTLDANKIAEARNSEGLSYRTICRLGEVYFEIGDNRQAGNYYQKALDIYLKTGRGDAVDLYWGLANIASRLGHLDKAEAHYQNALKLSLQEEGSRIPFIYINLGVNDFLQGEFDRAIENYKQGLEIFQGTGNQYGISVSYINLGEAYGQLGRFREAIEFLNKGINISRENGDIYVTSSGLQMLSDTYRLRGDYKSSLDYFESYVTLKDSLFNVEKSRQIAEMQTLYETGKKEAANRLLMLENQEKEGEISRQRAYLAGAVLVTLAVFFLSLFIYRTNRRTQRLNQQISAQAATLTELNRTKDRLFSIISHDLRGPIASFESVTGIIKSYLQRKDLDKVDEIIVQVDKSARNLNQLLDNLLNWSMSQQNEISLDIRPLEVKPIVEEVMEICGEAAITKGIAITADGGEGKVLADYHTFSAVVRNLVSNALKFSPSGSEIVISYRPSDRFVELTVEDQGMGIPEENIDKLFQIDKSKVRRGTAKEKGTGLGLVLVKEFVELNNGSLQVSSTPGKGTTFRVSLPLVS